jgi:uncharacterized membrane protein YkvA (DUF1232 family)
MHIFMTQDKQNTNIEIIPPNKESFTESEEEKPTGWKKWFYIIVSIIMGIYVFIPEFTDVFPIIGWIDEGIAILILTYALNRLGIKIPFLEHILNKKKKHQSE